MENLSQKQRQQLYSYYGLIPKEDNQYQYNHKLKELNNKIEKLSIEKEKGQGKIENNLKITPIFK
jgi:hypothetical protein